MNLRILLIFATLIIAGTAGYFIITAESGDYAKVLILTLYISDNGVTPLSEEIRYGHAPATGLRTGAWQGRLLDADGKTVRQFAIWDPRVQFGDSVTENGSILGKIAVSGEADLLLILPFTGKEDRFTLTDTNTGTRLATVSLEGAAVAFNSTYPDDPDLDAAAETGAPRQIPLPVLAAGCILIILLIFVAMMMVRGR